MVIGGPARRLAMIADANFAAWFAAICTPYYATQHYVSQTSAKTWVPIGSNSGEDRAKFGLASWRAANRAGRAARAHRPVTLSPITLPLLTTNAVVLPPEHVVPTATTTQAPPKFPPPPAPPLLREAWRAAPQHQTCFAPLRYFVSFVVREGAPSGRELARKHRTEGRLAVQPNNV